MGIGQFKDRIARGAPGSDGGSSGEAVPPLSFVQELLGKDHEDAEIKGGEIQTRLETLIAEFAVGNYTGVRAYLTEEYNKAQKEVERRGQSGVAPEHSIRDRRNRYRRALDALGLHPPTSEE